LEGEGAELGDPKWEKKKKGSVIGWSQKHVGVCCSNKERLGGGVVGRDGRVRPYAREKKRNRIKKIKTCTTREGRDESGRIGGRRLFERTD